MIKLTTYRKATLLCFALLCHSAGLSSQPLGDELPLNLVIPQAKVNDGHIIGKLSEEEKELETLIAQIYGSRCVLPNNYWCTIYPQPVGTRCYCGQDQGTTWQ